MPLYYAPNRLLTNFEQPQIRTLRPIALGSAGFVMVSGTAYFVFLGRLAVSLTPTRVAVAITTVGAGAQTAEMGLFSTTAAPNAGNLSMTKLVATGTVDALTATGFKRNTSAFATSIDAGTYLWAGFRTAMATTQPTCLGLAFDLGHGEVQTLAASGALTGAGPFAATIPADTVTAAIGPYLTVRLD